MAKTSGPFDNEPANKAWARYEASDEYLPPIAGPTAIQNAFAAGWDGHIQYRIDQQERRNVAASGCGVPLMLVAAIILASSTGLALGFELNQPDTVAWERVAGVNAVALLLLFIGWRLLLADRAKANEARKIFRDTWGV